MALRNSTAEPKQGGAAGSKTQEDPVSQRILSSFPHFNPLDDKCANVQTRVAKKKCTICKKHPNINIRQCRDGSDPSIVGQTWRCK